MRKQKSDTDRKKKWTKRCPNCNDIQIYKTENNLKNAIKRNTFCKRCRNRITNNGSNFKKHTETTKQILREKALKQFKNGFPSETKEKISKATSGSKNGFYGKTHSQETKKHWSKIRTGVTSPMKGKKHTQDAIDKIKSHPNVKIGQRGDLNPSKRPEVRLKLRKKAIERISKQKFNGGQVIPSYNISSISIIETKAKELGIADLQHAENGGEFHIKELGYFVDGYSKEKNIVIEYYEKHHQRQKEKDERRQKEIEEFLCCKFIIIKE